MKIAVVGSGISGLSCGYRLSQAGHQVSLFEANDYFGGHSHTVDVTLDGYTYGVDTGFLVFNHKTYPHLVRLFDELAVETASTDMSFSVKVSERSRRLEWAGTNLDAVFAQRRNLFSPRFLWMLRDILRFNRQATALARCNDGAAAGSLGDYLDRHHYSEQFRSWYLLPMAACIWSCPTRQMLDFPLISFIRFCHNHGLLRVNDRPQWRTVKGGSRCYVDKLLAGIAHTYLRTAVKSVTRVVSAGAQQVRIDSRLGTQVFDHVVMACHSDQSLRMLPDASATEQAILSAVKYQTNSAVLHTDSRFLPDSKKAWSAWNYQSGAAERVCVHYLINQLQPVPFKTPLIVTLNPLEEPRPHLVIDRYEYAHPVFDAAALNAQRQLDDLQGQRNTWFAGAWTGYGFHEDGLKSGLAIAEAIALQPERRSIERAAA